MKYTWKYYVNLCDEFSYLWTFTLKKSPQINKLPPDGTV